MDGHHARHAHLPHERAGGRPVVHRHLRDERSDALVELDVAGGLAGVVGVGTRLHDAFDPKSMPRPQEQRVEADLASPEVVDRAGRIDVGAERGRIFGGPERVDDQRLLVPLEPAEAIQELSGLAEPHAAVDLAGHDRPDELASDAVERPDRRGKVDSVESGRGSQIRPWDEWPLDLGEELSAVEVAELEDVAALILPEELQPAAARRRALELRCVEGDRRKTGDLRIGGVERPGLRGVPPEDQRVGAARPAGVLAVVVEPSGEPLSQADGLAHRVEPGTAVMSRHAVRAAGHAVGAAGVRAVVDEDAVVSIHGTLRHEAVGTGLLNDDTAVALAVERAAIDHPRRHGFDRSGVGDDHAVFRHDRRLALADDDRSHGPPCPGLLGLLGVGITLGAERRRDRREREERVKSGHRSEAAGAGRHCRSLRGRCHCDRWNRS